ncbi:MAG TPA: transglutaminase-like domain-containing protein [Thermoanaerobaculia bacterium]
MRASIVVALLIAFCTSASAGTVTAPKLAFTKSREPLTKPFQRSASTSEYLQKLRAAYQLDEVVRGAASDYDRVRAMSRWVRTRWEHNGSNEPSKYDPITILEEASKGQRFRCVEYSIVLAAALNSVGVPARVLNLKTVDAETRESGAGHVVAEAYLRDRRKWVMVDGQFDVIPMRGTTPLNAVEFQQALSRGDKRLTVATFSGAKADGYFEWVAPYLYYFGTKLDARYDVTTAKDELILYPVGAKQLAAFQRRNPMKDKHWTHSLRTFYAAPVR